MTLGSFISDFWNDQLVANDRQWLFLVLLGLLLSFGFIRLSTRLMCRGSRPDTRRRRERAPARA
jgi:hypothetical protein